MSQLVENSESVTADKDEKPPKTVEIDKASAVNGNREDSEANEEPTLTEPSSQEDNNKEAKDSKEEETDKVQSEEVPQVEQNTEKVEEKMEIDLKMTEEENKGIETKDEESEPEQKDDKEDEQKHDDDDEEEEESDSEEELPPGLLEKPIEILKDKRERKKTARFTYDDSPASVEKKKFEVPEGRGIKLAQHPRVEWQLQKNKTEDLKIIHKLFFGTFGDAFACKKNMRNFSGFPFDRESPEYEKKEDYIGRFTLDNLKWALAVCDVDNKKGKKEDLIDSLLEWCLCPKPSGKEVPAKKKRKEKPQKKKKPRKSTDKNKSNSSIASDDVSDDSGEEEVTPKKPKPAKKAKTPKSTEKKSPKKRKSTTSGAKIAKIKIGSPKKTDGGDSDDSDAPLKKKAKKSKPPTNPQIRKAVEGILKGADLEVITMKLVCMKVYALYPNFDLSDRKTFIKETVKSIIS